MKSLVGKYIAVHSGNSRFYYLDRIEFLLVTKETKKQVKAKESENSFQERTINKNEILGLVSIGNISKKRIQARDIQNEYSSKRKKLHDKYLDEMLSLA